MCIVEYYILALLALCYQTYMNVYHRNVSYIVKYIRYQPVLRTNPLLFPIHFCSGAEDKHGYIWDRHYNICLARLRHDDVVNSVAFSPTDQELLLSASDDSTIKVWRSPRMVRLARRPTRARDLLASLRARRNANTNLNVKL